MALGEMKKKLQNIMVQNNFLENLAQDKNIKRMNNIVFSFIIFDTIVLCFDGTTLQRDELIILYRIDFALLLIFYIEVILRILIMPSFFKDVLNLIDLCLVLMNIIVKIYLAINHVHFLDDISSTYQIVRSFHILRIFRILLTNTYWKSISVLLIELIKIINELKELLCILLIFFMVFSLIGRDLLNFRNLTHPLTNEEIERVNFDNLYNSILANFLIFNDEEWHLIMLAHIETFSGGCAFYFVFNLLVNTIFLNKMFLASFINKLVESKNVQKIIENVGGEESPLNELSNSIKKEIKTKISIMKSFLTKLCIFNKKNKEKQHKKSIHFQKNVESKITKCFGLFRKLLERLTKNNKYFDNFMIIIIILSVIALGFYDPYQATNSEFNLTLKNVDIPIFMIFAIELVVDIIVQGKKVEIFKISLKFFICILLLLSFFYDLRNLKILLLCRLFLLFHFSKDLKLAVVALMKSFWDILQFFFFFFLVSLLFASIGVKCFKGTFFYCDSLNEEYLSQVITKEDCLDFGGDWINQDFNFDNIFKALELLFLIANTEGWLPLM